MFSGHLYLPSHVYFAQMAMGCFPRISTHPEAALLLCHPRECHGHPLAASSFEPIKMTFVASTGFPSGPFCSTFSVNNFRYFHRSSQPLRTPSALNTYRGKGTKIMAVADRRRRGVFRDVEELITAIEPISITKTTTTNRSSGSQRDCTRRGYLGKLWGEF